MGRPRAKFPTPGKRRRGRTWQVYWRAGARVFGLSLGPVGEDVAESRRLGVALALRTGEWPEWTAAAPAVRRYVALQQGAGSGDLLGNYAQHLRGEVSATWARTALGHLRELDGQVDGGLAAVTASDAQRFLDAILRTPGSNHPNGAARSVGTRNRALAACSRFFKWGVRTGALAGNPFAGLHQLREHPPEEIVYLTSEERDVVLEAARGLPAGVAVWLALWVGLRRGEVAQCQWAHVDLERGRLVVVKSKTGRRRTVPLAAPLAEFLAPLRPSTGSGRGGGRVVPWPAGQAQWEHRSRRALVALAAACPTVPEERIRWNVFRHTFGSLLAQAGVGLDKISAWMGNSPAVCRRHYAEFVPRDRRDEDIDLLGSEVPGDR